MYIHPSGEVSVLVALETIDAATRHGGCRCQLVEPLVVVLKLAHVEFTPALALVVDGIAAGPRR
jgi:hypothetical protein